MARDHPGQGRHRSPEVVSTLDWFLTSLSALLFLIIVGGFVAFLRFASKFWKDL